MKVIFDSKEKLYCIKIEDLETTTLINVEDIVEARDEFIAKMTWLFNQAVNRQLKD